MDEQSEDMLIALYPAGEGAKGFDKAHMKKCFEIMEIIRRVRKEIKKQRG